MSIHKQGNYSIWNWILWSFYNRIILVNWKATWNPFKHWSYVWKYSAILINGYFFLGPHKAWYKISAFPDSANFSLVNNPQFSVRLAYRWKKNIEMDHEQGGKVWTVLNLAVDWDWWQACIIVVINLGSHKLQGSSWLMEALLVSQEGLCSMKLVQFISVQNSDLPWLASWFSASVVERTIHISW